MQKHWLRITTLLVLSASAIGCYLPSIWGALALVGATTSTVQAFIIPGLVIISVERVAAKALAASSSHTGRAAAAQHDREHGLSTPLLAGSADAEAGATGMQSAAGAGVPAGSYKVDRPVQPRWLCICRQIVAVFAIFVGVALFLNSVLEALWSYVHPRAEGLAVIGLYRMLASN